MQQVTLRLPDDLAASLKRRAHERGESANAFATLVLRVAVDGVEPDDGLADLRERLRRAGLLAQAPTAGAPPVARPAEAAVAQARARAGTGTPLAEVVAEGRR